MRAINFRPDITLSLALAFLPFLFLCLAYVVGSEIQLAENPQDKLLPAFSTMGEALDAYAMKPDTRTGQFLLWSDTAASMTRLLTGLAISTSLALVVGIVVDRTIRIRAGHIRAFDGAAACIASDPLHRDGSR